jgi:methylmalonyl-CoA mutase
MAPSDHRFVELPTLDELFDEPSIGDWKKVAEASLGDRPLERLTVSTDEGIDISPLYTKHDPVEDPGYPGQAPFVRGRTALGAGPAGWEVCQRVDHGDPTAAARQVRADLSRGATSIWLVFDPITRMTDDEVVIAPGPGVRIVTQDDFDGLCAEVDPATTSIHLDAGGNAAAVTAAFLAAARRREINPHDLSGSLGCDPLGAFAADGNLSAGLDGSSMLMVELARWTERHAPELRPITISTIPYHMAGATAVQELAFALATGVEYLRVMTAGGFDTSAACRRLGFRYAIGRDLFMEAAKLRAARRLWAKAAEACGATWDDLAAPIHAVASPRCLTRRDPWVNMLRTTVGSFAAVVGGADALTVLPFDSAVGRPDELARRIAANSQTILREESHLGRVVDPGGGSWYLEALTDRLARAAWTRFQAIEGEGGIRAALVDGRAGRELDATQADREQAVATRATPITGVSSFPNLDEERLERAQLIGDPEEPTAAGGAAAEELTRLLRIASSPTGDGAVMEAAVEAAAAGATIGQLAAALRGTRSRALMTPLPCRRESDIFDRLRDASDAWLDATGSRPRIFLANMGPVREHKPRSSFAVHFFEAGGIQALTNDGFATVEQAAAAFSKAGTGMTVICSSDARYPDLVPELATALEAAGARTVLVAGKPREHEEAWRAAGVTGFIHIGCDQYQLLVDLLQEEGVLHV